MAEENWWSKHGTTLIALLVALAVVGVAVWVWRPLSTPAPAANVSPSKEGFQLRYNATLALARRGSAKVPLKQLNEMLDEDKQLKNFTEKNEVNEELARRIVLKAIEAVGSVHKKHPELDISSLEPALQKLTDSRNLTLRDKARETLKELGK